MSFIKATGSFKWGFKMVLCKIISLGIKQIAIFNVRYFLYLSIKLYSFYIALPLSYSLNIARWLCWRKICSFSSYYELNFLWTFHCKLSLDWKDRNLEFVCGHDTQTRSDFWTFFFFKLVHLCPIVDLHYTFRDFSQYKALFHAFKFCSVPGFYLWKQKTILLMFEASFVSTFALETKNALPCVNVAKPALSTKIFSSLFTQA